MGFHLFVHRRRGADVLRRSLVFAKELFAASSKGEINLMGFNLKDFKGTHFWLDLVQKKLTKQIHDLRLGILSYRFQPVEINDLDPAHTLFHSGFHEGE